MLYLNKKPSRKWHIENQANIPLICLYIYIYTYIYILFLVYMLKSQRIKAYLFKTKIFKMAYLSKKYLKMKL